MKTAVKFVFCFQFGELNLLCSLDIGCSVTTCQWKFYIEYYFHCYSVGVKRSVIFFFGAFFSLYKVSSLLLIIFSLFFPLSFYVLFSYWLIADEDYLYASKLGQSANSLARWGFGFFSFFFLYVHTTLQCLVSLSTISHLVKSVCHPLSPSSEYTFSYLLLSHVTCDSVLC